MILYNENDLRTVAWLEELIVQGHLPAGIVDARSIEDLDWCDLEHFNQAHFFAGIGGWPHALAMAGWPADIRTWTGSCPCQPFSNAGRRRGTTDARHLWPAWFAQIQLGRPDVIFGEQVSSPDGRAWFDAVRVDLEGAGYAVGVLNTCAGSVGAPHIRQRLYFVAIAGGERCERLGIRLQPRRPWPPGVETAGCSPASVGELGDSSSPRSGWDARSLPATEACGPSPGLEVGRVADESQPAGPTNWAWRDAHVRGRRPHEDLLEITRGREARQLADSSGERWDARDAGFCNGEGTLCEDGQRPDDSSECRTLDGFWDDAEWIPCLDGKLRLVERGSCPLAAGLPHRVGALRGYGNAIVPQVAATFVRAVMEVL